MRKGGDLLPGILELDVSVAVPAENLRHSTFENSASSGVFVSPNAMEDSSGNSKSFCGNASGGAGV